MPYGVLALGVLGFLLALAVAWGGALLLTWLVPRRGWRWLLLIGWPLLAFWLVALRFLHP
ncbi:hypothetical protein [Deinococcus navajonensis]|uniref:Uncharacterized protein n=1 Tax=Deinococcus navajonensis TaxID=309884 RepID=A0ABV8XNV8_9DEIO